MTKISDEVLAMTGYQAYRSSMIHNADVSADDVPKWEGLVTFEMEAWSQAVAAIRKRLDLVEPDTEDKISGRFVEAVELAFQQMTIQSPLHAAAWYTLRDWLESQGKSGVLR